MMIKLTPHEQKILDLVKEHPDIIDDPEKRKAIAEQHGLSEKTLRNRIGDLKKYSVIDPIGKTGIIDSAIRVNSTNIDEINLYDYGRKLWKWKKFIFGYVVAITLIATIISLIMPKTFEASAVLMPPSQEQGAGILSSLSNTPFSGLLTQSSDETMSIIAILKSRTVMEDVVKKYNLINLYQSENLEEAVRKLREKVEFSVEEEGTIKITVNVMTDWFHPDEQEEQSKQLSADITNYFVMQLDVVNKGLKTKQASFRRVFIEERYQQNIEELKNAEEKLKGFQEKHNTANLTEQTTAIIQVATELVSQISISKVKISISKVKLSILEETLPKDHPEIKLLETEIILLETEITGLNKQLDELDYGKNEITMIPQFSEVPDLGLKLGRLMRDVAVQNALYTFLTQQYEEAKIQEARDTPTVQVLDYAVKTEKKSKPQRKLIVVLSFIFSAIISSLYVIIRENKPVF